MAGFISEEDRNLTGFAREIRLTEEDEQFDLAGYDKERVTTLMSNAFGRPFTLPSKPIKITFIVGGGKLVRAKYHDDLKRWVSDALNSIGYDDDKSAALGSEGLYKLQHDTNLNLMKMHVFPKLAKIEEDNSNSNNNDDVGIDTTSKEYIALNSAIVAFQAMIKNKVISWRQKKRLLKILQEFQEQYTTIETKLFSGQVLDTKEQFLYDNSESLEDKISFLQLEMKKKVDSGELTKSEKEELLTSMHCNLERLGEETPLPSKRISNVKERIEKVKQIKCISIPLVQAEAIMKLRLQVFPLMELEEVKGKTNSLTLNDLKKLEPKDDMLSTIEQLEMKSQGWWEDEDDWRERCDAELVKAQGRWSEQRKTMRSSNNNKKSATKQSTVWNKSGSSVGGGSGFKGGKGKASGRSAGNTSTTKSSSSTNTFASAFGGYDTSDSDDS